MELLEQVRRYHPRNAQETADRELMLQYLTQEQPPFSREHPAHFTASAWVVSPDRSQVLMVYHNLYRSWSWLGGHADGRQDLLSVALREVREESGLTQIRPVSEEIYSLEILSVNGHRKKGEYVPSHLHLNVTYLLEADPTAPLAHRPEENSAAAWFPREKAVQASTEPWLQEYIYTKLNEKLVE